MTTTTSQNATPQYNTIGAGAIKFLRSPLATLIVLCSALLAQLPHAADVFRLIVMGDDWLARLHGYTYAVALELAVLLFVVQHRNVESYVFAAVSILVNLSYYYLHGVALLSVAALPAWLVSIALPAAIAQYSHLIVAATEQGETQPAAPTTAKRRHWQFWRKPQEAAATNIQAVTPTKSPVALPSATTGHSSESPDDGEQPSATSGQAHGQLDAASDIKRRLTPGEKQTILNMSTNGMKAVDIATQMQLNENTVRSTIARASKPTMHTNGAAK